MYLDALSFLEDERDAWRPFEGLDSLTDAHLEQPVDAAHGWSGRDLMCHLLAWLEVALAGARELAVSDRSPTLDRVNAEWASRGDALNDDLMATYRALPIEELRRRYRTVPGELRGYLTVVPEARWIKDAGRQASFVEETLEHYEDHRADLRAILDAARPA